MDAEGQLGGDFFSIGAPQTFNAAGNTGTGSVAVTITGVAALEPTNYQLTFDGAAYTLQRVDNGAVVPMTGAGTVGSPFVANGISIVVSGTPAASDQFYLKPLEHVAGTLSLLVTRPPDIAAAAPTRTSAARSRTPARRRSPRAQIINVAHPSLLTTSTIAFVNATTYTINGAGSFAYTPGAEHRHQRHARADFGHAGGRRSVRHPVERRRHRRQPQHADARSIVFTRACSTAT